MATSINTILSWFKTGLKPTQAQFWASWQSFWHKDEQIPQSNIADLTSTLNAKAEKSQLEGHSHDPEAHAESFELKLDKGTYPGNADSLKAEINAIYQPDILISSEPPTRIGNQFTYPANQYTALLNKTLRTNPDAFITTITAASTDYKRTDLIQFNPDNTLSKKVGTEGLTLAMVPEPDFGSVAVSRINVFGAVIEDPTPVTKEISIQDSLGVEKFRISDYLRIKGATLNASTKEIEINALVAGTIFVSNSGNDATAEPQNRTRPYKTLNAALAKFWTIPELTTIEIIDAYQSYTISVVLNDGTTRYLELKSNYACKVTVTTTSAYTIDNQQLDINMPLGGIIFNPTTSSTAGFRNATLNINCKNIEFGANYLVSTGNFNPVNITADVMTCRNTSPIIQGSGGSRVVTIKVNTLNFRGAGTILGGTFIYLKLDFNTLSHDNTFALNTATGNTEIEHGNVTSVAPYVNTTVVNYIKATNCSIKYKNGSIINSNLSISRFNCTGNCVITGIVNAINCDRFISYVNYVGLQINNASITTKNLIHDGGGNNTAYISITNSFIRLVGGGYLISYKETGSAITYANPTLEFLGSNYVIGDTDGFLLTKDETFWVSTNNPTIQITKGSLNTNGKFTRASVNLVDAPLKNYYGTIQDQLVIVDEKEELINKVLSSSKTYIINGQLTLLSGEYIEVPASGLSLFGNGYDISGITKNVAGQSIFKSPVGGSGNLTLKDCYFNSGVGSVFNLQDAIATTHAIELNDVNFNNCSSLGVLDRYRQFNGMSCGFYACADGFTIEGNWDGFKMINTNVINFGGSGTFFKKGIASLFNNRFYIDMNLQINTGAKICDFDATNFVNDKSLWVTNCYVKVNGIIDDTTTGSTFPNITTLSSKSYFVDNVGLKNSAISPYGISTGNLQTYADDLAAATGGINIGSTYIETSSGYHKTRLI